MVYRNELELTNRMAAAFGLALIGDERALEAFKHTLSSEFSGKSLDDAEVRTMLWHLDAIGLLARKSDAALAFLFSSMSVPAWRQTGKPEWTFANGLPGWTDEKFAVEAIRAIGISGRPEGMAAVTELARADLESVRPVAGAIFDAVFFFSYLDEHGEEGWNADFFPDGLAREALEWSQETEDGKQWFAWSLKIESSPAP